MALEIVENKEYVDKWTDLHPDLLNEIVKHVYSYEDYLSLRAVCKQWHLKLPMTPNHRRNPWLVLPSDERTPDTLNLYEKEIYHLRLPGMQNNSLIRGSCYGWLIIVGISDGRLQVLNPFTKAHFDLPPISALPNMVDYQPDRLGKEYMVRDILNGSIYPIENMLVNQTEIKKIIISSPPNNGNQDFLAVAIHGEYDRLALYKFGDKRWTDISAAEINCRYEDALFHKGNIYAINRRAQLYEFDIKTRLRGIREIPPPCYLFHVSTKYLIGYPDGGLLMVVKRLMSSSYGSTYKFDMYTLDEDKKQPVWSRVHSLGNYVLMLGLNSSIWMSPFSVGKGNHIYYTDDNLVMHSLPVVGGHTGILNLEDGITNQLFPGLLRSKPVWLLRH